MPRNHHWGWIVLSVGVLALILVPFMLFGETIEVWTRDFLETASDQAGQVALVLGLLLGGDILLPVPSSIASTAAGLMLGFTGGFLTSWIGMTISCVLGFMLASKMGHSIANRLVGEKELARFAKLQRRFGDWVIIVARPVPVLAEASVMFAGIARMPFGRFMLLTALSNLGISAVYAAVGAFSSNLNSFLLAFFGAILIPGVAMWLMNRVTAPAVRNVIQTSEVVCNMTTMDKAQQQMIDSPVRQLFQRYYEFGVIRRQLRRSQVQLQGKTILDAGCASGYSTQAIAQLFRPATLHAFDLMPEQVEIARHRGVDAEFSVGDIAAIDLPDAQFDAVFTFGVFHHVTNWRQAIAEVHRVLKPGGVLVGGEMRQTKDGAFIWAQFAQDLAAGGFQLRQSQGIYFGYFVSFVCQRA